VRRLCDAEKSKLSSDSGDSGFQKCKRRNGVAYGGIWRSLHLAGFWNQAVSFELVRLTVT
jgi:hypothetical protein